MDDSRIISVGSAAIIGCALLWEMLWGMHAYQNFSWHEAYKTVVSKNYSDLHVGQTVNLEKYDVVIQSGDSRVLQVANAGNGFYSSDLVIAVEKGDTDLIVSEKSFSGSSASKVFKVHVE